MVHNGIEYGLMAAFAEGFNILHHANAGLADRAADALDRARAYIADREHAGSAGLQRAFGVAARAFLAGNHETGPVELDAAILQPAGRGIGADEQEQIADRGLGFYTGRRFHVDSSSFRKWGANGKGATSPCVTEA